MIRALSLLVLLLLPSAAPAAQRSFSVGSFERIRVEGPFDVRLTIGRSPGAQADGDRTIIEDLDLRVEGTTLIVRAGVGGWGEQPAAGPAHAPVITVSTGAVRSANVIGSGRLTIDGPVRGQRIDLSVTGSGSLGVTALDADLLYATLLGTGDMALGGRAAKVHLTTSGSGRIAAAPLSADDLTVRLDGNGETLATARYTADVTTTGIGPATIYGSPACTVKAVAGGPVSCGKLPPP